jgi:YVTN family beta-propeller protein
MFYVNGLASTIIITNERSGDLAFMSEAGEVTDIVKLCNRPRGMARGASRSTVFIACSDDNTVIEFDTSKKSSVPLFSDLPGAMSLAVHEPSSRLFVTNEGAARATVLDTKTGNILATMPTGLEPDGIVITQSGDKIFVASENAGMVHVFDGNT